ncbi:PQQ-like domain-containing protein [Microbacterium hydrothermale]|uniref:outer membrane protein assembly factor BamB family protein n=1 Tax=Microbacterium TaxID=33882 RepID=UPI002226D782|nr:PQQ-binding-like beta-propeller repeat protein [Microbacterium hydrothermale]MCW2166430.1 PQQ-like domain-containing protein [Microbacterium hydrothermale]
MLGIVSTPDGTPIADVAVSNGRDVVLTDADGRFELPAATPFVTVTVPAGYSTGTWWLPAADDTQLAFVLEPREQTLPYEFIHLTDTHLTIPAVEAVNSGLYSEGSIPSELTAFLASLPDRAPAAQAIFVTGDLADHGIAEEFEAFSDAVAKSPLPMRVVPGNHDHMNGTHGSIISRNNYLTNTGDPALYERMIGPRWYSFDIPGLHVVAMDWHSHETGHDHDLQNAWLNADLAVREPGSPWMLLFHDQPGSSLLEHAPWQPIAAFSGHWHTSRVVRVDGTLHVNSPTTFFAGLDYTPPAYRRVIWDGEQITLHTETVTMVPDPAPLGDTSRATFAPAGHDTPADDAIVWRAQLHGAGHRQNVTVDGEIVFAGAQIEDEPLGFVEALDLTTGTPVWTTEIESAVKTAPVVWGDAVIAATVSGDVHGLDRATGERRWMLPSSDPLRRFAWNAPTVHDGVIYIGDQADLRAIDAATGDVLWRRTDIAPHHNLVNHSRPLIIDDLLVMGFWPTPQHPVGLNRHTGENIWATGDDSGELFTALKALLIMGTATYDAAEDAVLMPAFAHTVRVDRETGAIEWVTAHPGAFSPASPIVTPNGYVVTATGHGLLMLDHTTGDIRWDREITGEAPFPMRSYSKAPHPVIAPPTLIADRLVLPGLDGLIRVFDLDGNLLSKSQIGSPLAAELTVAGDLLLTVGTDGIVIALSTPALLARTTNNPGARAEVSA